MRKSQWFVLALGLIFISFYFSLDVRMWGSCATYEEYMLVGCMIRKYAYTVPGILSGLIGVLFIICGFLEKKR